MSMDTRLREHLHQSGDNLPLRPADLDAVMARGQRRKKIRLGAVVSVAVVAITGAVLLAQAMPPEETVVTEVPTPTTAPLVPGASENGWIAYATWPLPNEGGEIFIVKEGEPARAIVDEGSDHPLGRCPAFSPDGSMLAYLTQPENAPERDVVILGLDPDATVIRTVLTIQGPYVDCPKWSPDSTMVAFGDVDDIAIVDLSGNRRELAIPEGSVGEPSWMAPGRLKWSWVWTPDSRSITTVYDSALWSVPIDGGAPALVTDSETLFGLGRYLNSLQWSPDGSEILVSFSIELQNDTFFIGRIRINDGDEVTDILPGKDAQWSPDGTWILYLGPVTGDSLTVFVSDEPRLVSRGTGEGRSLNLGPHTDGHRWSPDSTSLVFTGDHPDAAGSLYSQGIKPGSTLVVLVGETRELDYTGGWSVYPQISWQPVGG